MSLPGGLRGETAGAPAAPAEVFRPDRDARATRLVDGEEVTQFPVRQGKAYPVLRHNRRDTMVLIAHPGDPSRTGWVRFAPAELVPPGEARVHSGARPYSHGWAVLYRALDGARDGELEAGLRALNRNIWTLGYDAARDAMYSSLDNREGLLRCVYTGLQFPAGQRPGEGPDGEFMNAEHTWPQSFFDKREPMRSDLHHLFPTESEANGERGHKEFRELGADEGVAVGEIGARSTEEAFEPPAAHKGNVARALFYFAVQFQQDISRGQEATLRAWHEADPVDDAERARNQRIYELQRSRNFFVDHPELVARIADF